VFKILRIIPVTGLHFYHNLQKTAIGPSSMQAVQFTFLWIIYFRYVLILHFHLYPGLWNCLFQYDFQTNCLNEFVDWLHYSDSRECYTKSSFLCNFLHSSVTPFWFGFSIRLNSINNDVFHSLWTQQGYTLASSLTIQVTNCIVKNVLKQFTIIWLVKKFFLLWNRKEHHHVHRTPHWNPS
jgi:hypothetical protein